MTDVPTASPTDSPLPAVSDALADAVERAGGSTVLVDARRRLPASGVVWSSDGLIVTADHVLERDEEITVSIDGERRLQAELVGRDPGSDLAVIRVAPEGLTPAARAPEGSARVGHMVLAVGRPGAGGPQASLGVVSGVGGTWRSRSGLAIEGFLRSDTTFLPGFSGGPLVDVEGRVLGINSSRFRPGQGITIPVAAVATVVDLLLQGGRVRRAYLGVASQVARLPEALASQVDGRETGLLVVNAEADSPAGQAGLQVGDIIVALEDAPIADTEDLQAQLGPERVGATVRLSILRGGELRELQVVLAERE